MTNNVICQLHIPFINIYLGIDVINIGDIPQIMNHFRYFIQSS